MGLREQIKEAPSEEAIDRMLNVGKYFAHASDSTRRRWKRTAERRRKQLTIKNNV